MHEAILFHGGPIYTLDPAQPNVEALAVREGRIVVLGNEEQVRTHIAGSRVEQYHLQGRALIPSLTDAHVHILWHALNRSQADLRSATTLEMALERVRLATIAAEPRAWVRGFGWDHESWGRWPVAADLDPVTAGHPALLTRRDGHSAWVNSAALQLAGIDDTTPDPPDGSIVRDDTGRATGILLEGAIGLVQRHIPDPTPTERLRALRAGLHEALSYGLTTLHCPSIGRDEAQAMLHDLKLLYERGELPLRCLVHLPLDGLDAAIELGLRSGLGDRWLRIGGLKLFADGSLGSQTAEMLAPYVDSANTGCAMHSEEALFTIARRASAAGIALVVHAIGDAANRKVLDTIAEATHPGDSPLALPHRIEHAQHLDPTDLPRFAQLGVIASMQPAHAASDMDAAARLLGERCATSYAWRSLLEHGTILAFGSDAPIEPLNPWLGVHTAVTRQRPDGTPAEGWYPEQCLSLFEALQGFVVGPAIASAELAAKGPLAPGRLADLAILATDLFAADPATLHATQVDATFVEGRLAYHRS